jgi:hypothetical protein
MGGIMMWRDIQSRFPGQQVSIAKDGYMCACSPGADFYAVYHRASMLYFLGLMGQSIRLLSPWLHNGELDDAVFKVFATFPMKRIQKGSQEGFPFDVEELTKQIEKEANGKRT